MRLLRRFLTFALLLSQCVSAQNDAARTNLVAANTRFAFKLFRQVVSQAPDKNLLVAPTGLSLTFALLDNDRNTGQLLFLGGVMEP
jgi:serine protease inhibitor